MKNKKIVVTVIDDNSSSVLTETFDFNVNGSNEIESLKEQVELFFDSVPYENWHHRAESMDNLNRAEKEILINDLYLNLK